MKTIKGVLWDNDGVLVNTEHLFYASNRELLGEHGVDLSPKQFFDWFLDHDYGAWHLLREKGYAEGQIDALREERNRRFGHKLQAARDLANGNVEAVLSHLWRRARMGVVTSSFEEHYQLSHRASGLAGYFDFAVTREMYPNAKPLPDSYLVGLARLGLPAAQCVAIEDSPRGLRAANAAGLECIIIRNEMSRDHAFDQAFCVVESMDELLGVLDSFLD
ncbi:MAG TPA: HAD family phosphatase [Janthinobacterium sp.]|nr:HAD family phosphatase [Janthinobacterium sp.]